MNYILKKSNNIGAISSSLCLLHCIATPFMFVVQACSSSCCESAPIWWQLVDYFFLIVAFFAVYHSTRTTTNKLIGKSLWISWAILLVIIINAKIQLFILPEFSIYLPALSLIVLHILNRKYCNCKTDQCCADNTENV